MGFMEHAADATLKTEAKKWGFRLLLNRGKVQQGFTSSGTLAGAYAEVVAQAQTGRTTATRVALGTAIAPGVGTIIGAMAKKKGSAVVVKITCPDGVLVSQTPSSDLAAAERFCAQFNARFAGA